MTTTATPDSGDLGRAEPGDGTGRQGGSSTSVLRRFFRHRLAVVGVAILVLMLLFSFLGPLLYVTDQVHTNLDAARLAPGTGGHPLGTDDLGHDVLGRLMVAGRISLLIGVVAGLLGTAIGAVWGAVAGYTGGWVDTVLMRIVDTGVAIPALFLLLVAATIVTPSMWVMALLIGIVSWLVPARLMRAETVTLREREYIKALRAIGGGRGRAVFRHVIPNAIGTVMVNVTFQIADAILLVAYVSFLGLGVPPPATDWGAMLSKGITYTYDGSWWLIVPAGVAIVLVVCAFNFIGDGLRDAFEVRPSGSGAPSPSGSVSCGTPAPEACGGRQGGGASRTGGAASDDNAADRHAGPAQAGSSTAGRSERGRK